MAENAPSDPRDEPTPEDEDGALTAWVAEGGAVPVEVEPKAPGAAAEGRSGRRGRCKIDWRAIRGWRVA